MRRLTFPLRWISYQLAMLRWLRSFPDAAVMTHADYDAARRLHGLAMPNPRDWGLE